MAMNTPLRFPTLAAFLALATFAACSDAPREAPESAASEPVPVTRSAAAPVNALEAATAIGVFNAHEPVPGLLTAGQLTESQMEALIQAGFKTFVSLRLPSEDGAGWEEAYAARRGVSFTRVPVDGRAGLTRANAEAVDLILKAASDGKTALYCGSANRVGALLAMRAHWLEGATPEEAMALGRAAGMRSMEPDVARLLAAGTP
ncbi:MAG: protein tyrosine phosphatase family protein [Longimicrobiales bacterium]